MPLQYDITPSLSTAVSLPSQGSSDIELVHRISEGQSISITFVVRGTPNITFTPTWHLQTYKHKHSFTLKSSSTSFTRERITNTHFKRQGITASASNIHHNASRVDCTLTLSGLGSEWGHLVVLFSVQAQCGCKAHAPAAALVEVMSLPRPPPTPVITPPPSMLATTRTAEQLQIHTTAPNGEHRASNADWRVEVFKGFSDNWG